MILAQDGYQVSILVQGYPGKTVCHGGLGWCTIALIRKGDIAAIVDTGSFGVRKTLLDRLAACGLGQADVTDVILTHAHYDHSVNWTLFPNARIHIGRDELAWAVAVPPGPLPIPELYMRELEQSAQLRMHSEGEEVIPGMRAYDAPGHTPGHLMFVLDTGERDIVFTGDAIKNRAEMITGRVDSTMNESQSHKSWQRIAEFWGRRPGSILIPGHDMPMVIGDGGKPRYLGQREAAITAWLSDDLETTTLFELTGR